MIRSVALIVLAGCCGHSICGAEEPERPAFHPKSMAYVLQADKLAKTRTEAAHKLAECGRDLVVIDPSFSANKSWTTREINGIRAGKPGRKVLAYLSIGEAEDYRDYWKKSWDAKKDGKPDPGAPKFLLEANPDWPGNYKVKYWDPQWQRITLASLDSLLAQGFDGVYLDIVDGFENFESLGGTSIANLPNSETNKSFRQDMVDWVGKIAAHARAKKPGFLVVPQNGSQLVELEPFLNTIDALGIEDLFTDGDDVQPEADVKELLEFIDKVTASGRPVLLIEYGKKAKSHQLSFDGAKKHGFTLLLTDRNLTTLGTSGAKKGQ